MLCQPQAHWTTRGQSPAHAERPRNLWRPFALSLALGLAAGCAAQTRATPRLPHATPPRVVAGRILVIPAPVSPRVSIPLYPNPQWTYIVIHHSATTIGNARKLDRAHRRRGFTNGLGYHFVIDNGTAGRRDGQIEVGPRWVRQEKGAHCDAGGMNQHGIGICLIGNFTHHPPSPAQMQSLVALVNALRAYYRIPSNHILRHRDVAGKITACPGDQFPWSDFRRRLLASGS